MWDRKGVEGCRGALFAHHGGEIACDQSTPEAQGPGDVAQVRVAWGSPWEGRDTAHDIGPLEGGHAGVCLFSFKQS